MPDFEASHDEAPPQANGDSLVHSSSGEDTPVAEVDEEVACVSVPLPVFKDNLGVPAVVELFLLDDDSVANDEHQQEHQRHHKVKVSVLVDKSVSEAVQRIVTRSEVQNESQRPTYCVDPEVVSPHEAVNVSVGNHHKRSQETPGECSNPSMCFPTPDIWMNHSCFINIINSMEYSE